MISACAPAKEVYPTRVGGGNVAVGTANAVPLVWCETPRACRCATACNSVSGVTAAAIFCAPLKVAGREQHPCAGRYGEGVGNRSGGGGEGYLTAVRCSSAVGGVGTYIIGGAGGEAGKAACKRACTSAIGGVGTANGRILRSAIAHAAGGNRGSAIGSYIAAGGGGSTCNTACRGGGYCGGDGTRGEGYLAAVGGAGRVGGVGSHIVGGAGVRPVRLLVKLPVPSVVWLPLTVEFCEVP